VPGGAAQRGLRRRSRRNAGTHQSLASQPAACSPATQARCHPAGNRQHAAATRHAPEPTAVAAAQARISPSQDGSTPRDRQRAASRGQSAGRCGHAATQARCPSQASPLQPVPGGTHGSSTPQSARRSSEQEQRASTQARCRAGNRHAAAIRRPAPDPTAGNSPAQAKLPHAPPSPLLLSSPATTPAGASHPPPAPGSP
jgi:hypothetical protein